MLTPLLLDPPCDRTAATAPRLKSRGDRTPAGRKQWETWAEQQRDPEAWYAWRFAHTLYNVSGPPATATMRAADLQPYQQHWFARCATQPALIQKMAELVLQVAWNSYIPLPDQLGSRLLRDLCRHGADPQQPDALGRTWMHWARDEDIQTFLLPVFKGRGDVRDELGRTLGHWLVDVVDQPGRTAFDRQIGHTADVATKKSVNTSTHIHEDARRDTALKGLASWHRLFPGAAHTTDPEGWSPLHRLAQLPSTLLTLSEFPTRFEWPGTDPHGYTALRRKLHWSLDCMVTNQRMATQMNQGADAGWLARHMGYYPAETKLRGPEGATDWEWILSRALDASENRSDLRASLTSWLFPLAAWENRGALDLTHAQWFRTYDLIFSHLRLREGVPSSPIAPQGSALEALDRLPLACANAAELQHRRLGLKVPMASPLQETTPSTALRPRL